MDDPGLIFFEETKFALNMISIIGLGLTKCSILVLYKNIFDVKKFRIVVYCVLAYVIAWTVSFSFSHLFTCYPITACMYTLLPSSTRRSSNTANVRAVIEPYYGNQCVQTVPMFLALLVSQVCRGIFTARRVWHFAHPRYQILL